MNRLPYQLSGVVLALCTGAAGAQQTVTSIKPLLIEALRLGESHGTMGGDVPAITQRLFGSSEPMVFDLKRVSMLAEAGCGVIDVTVHQGGVMEPASKDTPEKRLPVATKRMTLQMRYCLDGHIPAPETGAKR